VYKHIF